MKRNPFKIRLTGPQIARLALWSCVFTVGMLLLVKYRNGAWIGHASPNLKAWVTALVVPACDLLLALDIFRKTRSFRLARPLLYAGLIMGAFAAVVLWTWRG